MKFTATIYFDANNEDDARSQIEAWGLPQGATVTAQAASQPITVIVAADGTLQPPGGALILNAFDPPSTHLGDPDITLRVLGQNFPHDAIINFDGDDQPTVYINSGEVQMTVTSDDPQATVGTYPVYVRSPAGHQSNSADFTITP